MGDMKIENFFAELKRRNVYKVAVAMQWLVAAGPGRTQVFPFFEIPNWAVRLIVLAIVIDSNRARHRVGID